MNETWIDSSIVDSLLHVPGYLLYRRDRDLHGGGVAFYVHSSLNVSHCSNVNTSLEALFLRVHVPTRPNSTPLVVGSVYRPPSSPATFWDTLSHTLEQIYETAEHLLILGDLNVDVLNPGASQYTRLQQFCVEYSLKNVITLATRPTSQTCLDLALVSPYLPAANPSVVPLHGISDHDLVMLAITFEHLIAPPTHRFITVRKPHLSRVDHELCNAAMVQELDDHLDVADCSQDLSKYVSSWTNNVNTVINQFAPLKRVVKSSMCLIAPSHAHTRG